MPHIRCLCPHCRQLLEVPLKLKGQTFQCPKCQKLMRFPVDPPSVPTKKTSRRRIAFFLAGCALAVLIAALISRPVAPPTPHSVATSALRPVAATWITISYADLLDKDAIIRTGQRLGSALHDDQLRNAVQPFVDRYSQLLPVAIELTKGPDQIPSHSVLDFFALGERQPAWVAILRGGRIHIVTDDKNHTKVFLLGDDPQQSYSQNYSVVRHCLSMLSRLAKGDLNVDVFAYHNDYANSELRLNTTPYSFRAHAFEPRKASLNLDALTAFFAEGPEIQGAALKKGQGLILYGSEGPKQMLAGNPVELSDLAVAYRAVFHAGDNKAFISLDPNKDPTRVTVNFGGFLENTRLGSVVLEADKRFKTITSGLDPNSFKDLRNYTRNFVPTFLSGAERDLLNGDQFNNSKWIGTRFWYYPDTIGVDSDLNWEYAVITHPRFTADAERSREDFASPEDFERKKRNTLSPSIRASIDDLNRNYAQYAQAFSEISELTTIARLMGLCSWLSKAQPDWLDCDELLSVDLPPWRTDIEKTQLIAATVFLHTEAEMPDQHQVAAESKVFFITPILERTVGDVFQSSTNIVRYLSGEADPSVASHRKFDLEAASLLSQYQNSKVRDMLHSKRDVELFAEYVAGALKPSRPAAVNNLKTWITANEAALTKLESTVKKIEERMSVEMSSEDYNALVDRHNELVDEYEQRRTNLNPVIERYNALDIQHLYIVEIGGGIDLEPSKFAIRQNASSPRLIEFENRIARVGHQWTDLGDSGKWIRSDNLARRASTIKPLAILDDRLAVADQVKHWVKTDVQDGSWRTAIRLDASRAQEKSYDARQQTLQVAEFAGGQLQSLLVAQKDGSGRIVFKRAERQNVLPPQDPPVWVSTEHSELGGRN